jgi:diguanylate cyclase (GGDEF)-like protein
MFDRFLGVDRRLVPLVTVLLVAGFLATSLASYFVSRASVREGIVEGELPLTADNIYTEIQKDLLRPIFISSMMAHDTFLRDWVIGGEHDVAQIAKYLDEIKVKYDTISTFFVSDKTRTYYYSDGVLKRMSPDDWRDVWFFRVRQMAEPYEINVDPDFANQDTMTIFINFRLLDYQGQFLGAVGVGQTVNSLRKQIDRYHDRFGRDVYFVDSSGKIVLAGAGARGATDIAAKPGLAALAPKILAGSDGSFQYRSGLHTVFLNTRFIPELGWHVFVEQDEAAATVGIWHTLLANLAICLVITSVVVLAVHAAIRAFQGRIHEMAITDKLTGLLNRHGFEARFAQALKESKRSQEAVSVVLFDIDRFKEINDHFGHVVGDSCLAEVAQAARTSAGDAAAMCRWGGDEFLVLFAGVGLAEAFKRAEKISDGVAARPFDHEGQPIKLTVSLGVAQQRPGEGADRLIARADAALYDAKSRGRQRVAQAS